MAPFMPEGLLNIAERMCERALVGVLLVASILDHINCYFSHMCYW